MKILTLYSTWGGPRLPPENVSQNSTLVQKGSYLEEKTSEDINTCIYNLSLSTKHLHHRAAWMAWRYKDPPLAHREDPNLLPYSLLLPPRSCDFNGATSPPVTAHTKLILRRPGVLGIRCCRWAQLWGDCRVCRELCHSAAFRWRERTHKGKETPESCRFQSITQRMGRDYKSWSIPLPNKTHKAQLPYFLSF